MKGLISGKFEPDLSNEVHNMSELTAIKFASFSKESRHFFHNLMAGPLGLQARYIPQLKCLISGQFEPELSIEVYNMPELTVV